MDYPKVITSLPQADVMIEGVKAWILQGRKHQLVFFEFKPGTKVPEHSHDYDQWGMLIEGKMQLVINGEARKLEKGDDYVIPARTKHLATFQSKTRVMDFFSEEARYKEKTT